jgi:membrane protein YdbS with pleckstrin-like domain
MVGLIIQAAGVLAMSAGAMAVGFALSMEHWWWAGAAAMVAVWGCVLEVAGEEVRAAGR